MPGRVLIVLPDPDRVSAISIALAAAGADSLHVPTVDEALRVIDQAEIGAVVVDIHLPRTSALVLAQRLRARSNGRHVVAIALTRIDTPDVRRIARDAGYDECLPDTTPPREIATAIFEGARR